MTDADQLRRIAELNRESLQDWFRRFVRERGMPELSDAEVDELVRLSAIDERDGHQ